jgi:hypothetical protein
MTLSTNRHLSGKTGETAPPDQEDEARIRTGPWSEEDIETLIEMWHLRHSNADIADVLDRAENAVAIKASRLSLPPRRELEQAKGAKIRKCLRCATSFHSHGAGNRICDTCKSSHEWRSGGSDYYHVLSGR